ncbi:MAG TPA: OmpA family protein [Solimonas sp.]|nr:OmpA family protein [Solimonas sp.]
MNKTTRIGLTLALAAVALPASAVNETRPYIFGGYQTVIADRADRPSDNADGYAFSAGKALNKFWGVEFGGFWQEYGAERAGDNNYRELGGSLDALFFYSRDRAFSPYVGLGVGAQKHRDKTNGQEETEPFGTLGVGFFKYFGDDSRYGFRADVRARYVDSDINTVDNDLWEPVAKIGLVAALGPRLTEDGVIGGPDSDGDGVPDEADLCPNTPKGVKVDSKGCPVDSDGDGVPDAIDKCPGTPKGVKVDSTGCSKDGAGEGPNRRFEDVHFEFDKSDLTDYARAILDNASKAIGGLQKQYPSLKVDVSGHTDWIGTDAYNQALSERRANSVKQYMVRKGVEAKRVNTYAYGESKPVATNETDEGRAQNRRAEVRTRGE